MNKFGRGIPRDHSCEVWSKSNERFQRRRSVSKKVDGQRTTDDDGQRPVTIAHPEHCVNVENMNFEPRFSIRNTENLDVSIRPNE